MDIQRMHSTFRTLGQQMGMQLVRAIRPESIDVYLNDAINDKVRSVVLSNTTTQFNDRVAIQDNSISPVNGLRTLIKKSPIPVLPIVDPEDDFYIVKINLNEVMFYTSFGVKYQNYKRVVGTRFIENDKLNDTRADYCNKESWEYPIVSMYSDENDDEYVELYKGESLKVPSTLDVTYIQTPDIVNIGTYGSATVNCNIPEAYHNEIVKDAVNKFFSSVGATTRQVNR